MSVLETRDLVKSYGRVQALRGLSVSVSAGAVGLLGPNGAGKSSLIKIVLGLVPATSGSVEVFGLDARRHALRIRQQIGYMPENESFIPGMDAVTYVYLAGRLVGMPHAAAMQRTHVVLNYVGLDEVRYRAIESYSTGMKQKVKFAQALVHHPRLLLLDEPTSALDPRGREEMLSLIRDVSHGKGINVLLSTHILPDVESVCDEVVIMDRGTLIRQGAIGELRAGPEAYDVRIKGDARAFLAALAAQGCASQTLADGTIRVRPADGTAPIVRTAAETGVQLRALTAARTTLEELFTRMLAERRDHGRS